MEFELSKEELLKPLQMVIGVVDKKQLQPVLSFVLLTFSDNELTITATDLDIELTSKSDLKPQNHLGQLLLPGRKLLDICKSLPDNSLIKITETKTDQIALIVNRSRFTLSKLNPEEFPVRKNVEQGFCFSLEQSELKQLLNLTSFAIAQQDVRHYLMGMLWEFTKHQFKVVSTDGHRLATASYKNKSIFPNHLMSVIVPRKSINELSRLLDSGDGEVSIQITDGSVIIETNAFFFVTNLIGAKFPDYNRVFPEKEGVVTVELDRSQLKHILGRVSVLSNEKHKAVRFCFSEEQLVIAANNQEQEQAEEVMSVAYTQQPFEICFNYHYLNDVLQKVQNETVKLIMKKSNTPILISLDTPSSVSTVSEQEVNDDDAPLSDVKDSAQSKIANVSYIIMPMCI